MVELNRFTRALARVLTDRVLDEKWLFAPSLRVGYQWLDAVTRSGTNAVNVRVKSLPALALELASADLERRGLAFAGELRREALLTRVFAARREREPGYLGRLTLTPSLIQSLLRTVSDLRLAGLAGPDLRPAAFEVSAKAVEMTGILTDYERALADQGLVDYADALRIAADRVRKGTEVFPPDLLSIVAEDLVGEFRGLEKALWESLPRAARLELAVDQPGSILEDNYDDRARLGWVLSPAQAPPARHDGTAEIFRAVGESNEIREILRRIAERDLPLDAVEIIHPDYDTYVPLIYELGRLLLAEEREEVPVTFSEGTPVSYSRPGRALLGLVELLQDDFPQAALARLIQDGLVSVPAGDLPEVSNYRLAAVFRSIPIGGGRDRCRELTRRTLRDFEARAAKLRPDDDESDPDQRLTRGQERLSALRWLDALVARLADLAPGGANHREQLTAGLDFLDRHVRGVSREDEYSLHFLRREVREMLTCIDTEDLPGFDPLAWLAELARQGRVGGAGPRPGRLFVTPLHQAGHSGREHTFIVGLDDSRFPGAGLQDPLLLDHERNKISRELGTAAARLTRVTSDFARLLARLRGHVCLSCSCQSISDDREMFPATVTLAAGRIIAGAPDLTALDLDRLGPEPATRAPADPERALTGAEWWLSKVGDDHPEQALAVVSEIFPHLGRGLIARAARASSRFTEYDGLVPDAGRDHDPTRPDGPVMSSSRLEKLAECPLEYFFKYVLKIEPPEEYLLDPAVWLDPLAKGGLLHAVFRRFMTETVSAGRLPSYERDLDRLEQILEQAINETLPLHPLPGAMVFERERRDLFSTVRIFLREEERHCRTHQPFCFEAAIGLPPDGTGTPLDTPRPVAVALGDGRSIQARGRIDRVDEIPSAQSRQFAVWDYKTGSAWKSRQHPPFWAGRCIQNALYLDLLQARLDELMPGARAVRFGYFYPSSREYGERVEWTAPELAAGRELLARLCDLIARGAFPISKRPQDFERSPYRPAFGDAGLAVSELIAKLQNPDNAALEPYRLLRGDKLEKE